MAKKKIPDPEIVPDEVEIEAKPVKQPTRKVVETKTVTYDAPAVEVPEEDEGEDFDFEEKPKRNKPTLKQEKQKLRDRWAKRGIAPTGNLRISLWKFTNEDDPMSGNQADKAFCSKFVTTESAIDDGIHLDAASKFGPGRYWIMIYLNNQIVDQWEFRIAANQQMGQIHGQQMVSMPDPQNPNVIVQMPANQPLPPQIDPMKQFRESLKMMKELREAMGMVEQPAQPAQQNPNLSPDEQMAIFAMKQPDLAKKAIKNLIGSSGDSGDGDMLKTVLEYAPPVIEALTAGIKSILSDFRGGNNGQAQMTQAALPHQDLPMENGQQDRHLSGIQMGQEGAESFQQGDGGRYESTEQYQMPQSVRPEDELFSRVLDFCKRRTPADIAAGEIAAFANTVEENPAAMVPGYGLVRQYPIGSSIWPFIEMFCETPIDQALAFVGASSESGAEIIKLPHAEAWATQLQAELKKAYEPGGME